jgi:hypothetical protein
VFHFSLQLWLVTFFASINRSELHSRRWQKHLQVSKQSVGYCCSCLTKERYPDRFLVKLSKIIFHGKPFSGSRVTPEVLKPLSSTSSVAVLLLASEHRHKMSLELPKIKIFKDQYAVSKENRCDRKHHFETRHLDNRQTDRHGEDNKRFSATSLLTCLITIAKVVPLHATKAFGWTGCIAPTHYRPRH